MRIQWNPIIKKDLRVAARSMRMSWGLFAYEAVLLLAFLLALAVIQADSQSIYTDGNIYARLISLFPVTAIAQVCIVTMIMPILTASAISGERERQTLDIMLTTCMSPLSIVLGKVGSAVVHILFFVMAGMPIMALSFVFGGLGRMNLLWFVLAIILLAVVAGSVGIFCSAICRKTITAVILSYVFYFVFGVLTGVPILIRAALSQWETVGDSMLFLLFNPIVFFEEFFMQIMTNESLFGGEQHVFDRGDVGFLTYNLAQGKLWMLLSAVCLLAVALLFLFGAAWMVNPMHSAAGRKSRGKRAK
ncbi:MAG: ABC transporter permease [Roseburia sp.]|nr:ABC transporter permease [Roseburia sp.]